MDDPNQQNPLVRSSDQSASAGSSPWPQMTTPAQADQVPEPQTPSALPPLPEPIPTDTFGTEPVSSPSPLDEPVMAAAMPEPPAEAGQPENVQEMPMTPQPRKKTLPVLGGVLALLLVAGVAGAAYYVSNQLSTRQAVAPNAPESKPAAANPICSEQESQVDCENEVSCRWTGSECVYYVMPGGECTGAPSSCQECHTTGSTPPCVKSCSKCDGVTGNWWTACTESECSAGGGGGGDDGDDGRACTRECPSGSDIECYQGVTNPDNPCHPSKRVECSADKLCISPYDDDAGCGATVDGGCGNHDCNDASSREIQRCANGTVKFVSGCRAVAECGGGGGGGGTSCDQTVMSNPLSFARTGDIYLFVYGGDIPAQSSIRVRLTNQSNANDTTAFTTNKNTTVSKLGPVHVQAGSQYSIYARVINADGTEENLAVGWNKPKVQPMTCGASVTTCGGEHSYADLLNQAVAQNMDISGVTNAGGAANKQCWGDAVRNDPGASNYDFNDFAIVLGYGPEVSPTGTTEPTGTIRPTDPTVGACVDIQIYKANQVPSSATGVSWIYGATPLTAEQLNNLKIGDRLKFVANTNSSNLKGRFRVWIGGEGNYIDGTVWLNGTIDPANPRKVFYKDYEVKVAGNYKFEAQVTKTP